MPPGGLATISEIRYVPAVSPRITKPTSIASPPKVVTMRASIAARREPCRSLLCPTSRNDRTVVSSQKT
ncbi:unannotated protein [freshwater metagenome]|uniref:Unannotated protein n=1 Tax=freshwater metagenome TaxID=449393 RepID=A0A6J7JBG8_9ZZZZ